jgi:hypothetical protein
MEIVAPGALHSVATKQKRRKKSASEILPPCGGRPRFGIRWMKIKGRKERLETVHRNG